ncbi:hypothetical protein [Phenylobacterium hankyongense]|nr:hypothetical protein [Phenylobacterium hankyongense]
MWIIFGLFVVTLFLAAGLNAPEWLKSAIITGYPVAWLVIATVISLRNRT